MENRYCAAVDLGTTKVIIAVARLLEHGKVEIVAVKECPSKGVIKGDLKNNEQALSSLREVKRQIEEELQIVINEVFVGISGQHIDCAKARGGIFVQNSDKKISEVKETDVNRLIDEMYNSALPPGKTIISVLPQTYRVDGESDIIEPVGMEGKRLEADFNIIMGENAAIERIERCFVRAGLKVQKTMLQPLASSLAVLSEDEKELGVAVVDIGGGTTDLCIIQDKIIRHIAVLPVGGNQVNRDIKSYGILDRHLEKLKTMFGEAVAEKAADQKYVTIPSISGQAPKEISVRVLADIIEARMCDIVEFVAEQIRKSGDLVKGGIVLTGGGSTLKNIDLLFRQKTGLDARVVSPCQHLTEESMELVASPKYSTIVGLLIDALQRGESSEILSTRTEEVVVVEPERKEEESRGGLDVPPVDSGEKDQLTDEQIFEAQRRAYEAGLKADELDDDYESEGGKTLEANTVQRPKFFGRIKRAFGSMFEADDVDAEDEYDLK